MQVRGRLIGLGVGPGDPELITLKALRLLPLVGQDMRRCIGQEIQRLAAGMEIQHHILYLTLYLYY